MKTPKARFQEVGSQAEAWRKLTSEILFEEATDAAMLHLIERYDPVHTQDGFAKIQGAKEFLRTLLTLGDIQAEEKPTVTRQINYEAHK